MANIIRSSGNRKKLSLSAKVTDVLTGKTFSVDGKNTLVGTLVNGTSVYIDNVLKSYKRINIKNTGNAWQVRYTLPYDFYNGGAVIDKDGYINILGGGAGDSKYNHYKLVDTTWTKVSTLPYGFYSGGVVLDKNGFINILGSTDTDGFTKHYRFNGTAWVSVSTLPYDFHGGETLLDSDGNINMLGSSRQIDTVYVNITKHYKFNGTSWVSVSTLPYNFFNGKAILDNDKKINIIGGNSANHYKWNGTSWVSVSTLPFSFSSGVVAYDGNGYLRLFGGYINNYTANYKLVNGTWVEDTAMLYNFTQGCAVTNRYGIHILGAYTSGYRKSYSALINTYDIETII